MSETPPSRGPTPDGRNGTDARPTDRSTRRGIDVCFAEIAARISDAGVQCTASSVEGGRLRYDRPEGSGRIVICAADDRPASGPSRVLGPVQITLAGADGDPNAAEAVLDAAAGAVEAVGTDDLEHWLAGAWTRRDEVVPNRESALDFFGHDIGLESPFWGSWQLADIEPSPNGFWLDFRADDRSTRVSLAQTALPDHVAIETPIGHFSVEEVGDDPLLAGLTRALRFVAARLQAADLRWGQPTDDPPDPDREPEDWSDDADRGASLVDVCSYGRGDLTGDTGIWPSVFFRPWTELDALGLTLLLENLDHGAVVAHSGLDCSTGGTTLLSRCLYSGQTPWRSDWPKQDVSLERAFVTGMDDVSVIMGGESRISSALAASMSPESSASVRVFTACDYHLIGDAVAGVCTRCASMNEAEVDYVPPHVAGYTDISDTDLWHDFVRQCVARVEPERPANRVSVNLAGYGAYHQADIAELRRLLGDIGIAVDAVVLPFASPGSRDVFASASLTLLSPWAPLSRVFGSALDNADLPYARIPLPFGVGGTMRWLEAVNDAVSGPPIGDAVRARWLKGLAARSRASTGVGSVDPPRIAVCFDAGTLQGFLEPTTFFGSSVLELFADIDCDLTLIAFPRCAADQSHDDDAIAAVERAGASFVAAEVDADPVDFLTELAFDVVYCEVGHGELAKRSGSVPVEFLDFRMGFAGAKANEQLLASWRRFSLYRQYSRYLTDRPHDRGTEVA